MCIREIRRNAGVTPALSLSPTTLRYGVHKAQERVTFATPLRYGVRKARERVPEKTRKVLWQGAHISPKGPMGQLRRELHPPVQCAC